MSLVVKFLLTLPISELGEHQGSFENLTLRVRQGSSVFNTEQYTIGFSSIRNLNHHRNELTIALLKDVELSTCHFYGFYIRFMLALGKQKSCDPAKKPASMCPNVLNKYEMTK